MLYETLDNLVRAGRAREARVLLRQNLSPDRAQAPWLAEIARRTGVPELGVKLLHRWVRPPERRARETPSAHEMLEYAGALVNLYALKEAAHWLDLVDANEHPQALFFRALASIHEWDHASAIRWLERYLAAPGVDAYRQLIGRANLALSLTLADRHAEARALLDRNARDCRESRAHLLLANTLETRARLEYTAGDARAAEQAIAEAELHLADPDSPMRDAFYIEKWRVLLTDRAREIERLRRRAFERRDYESAREIDLFLARKRGERERLLRAHFGSPYPAFRAMTARIAHAQGIEIPPQICWFPDSGKIAARAKSAQALTPPDRLLPRLLCALASDFYRPLPLHTLHERLYPGSFFNPRSSRDQLHQALKRLREELRGFAIVEDRGAYRLSGAGAVEVPERFETLPARAIEDLPATATAAELARRWKISKPTAITRLRALEAQGLATREGAGPSTRYRFNKAARAPGADRET